MLIGRCRTNLFGEVAREVPEVEGRRIQTRLSLTVTGQRDHPVGENITHVHPRGFVVGSPDAT
jgi:hypothetical protein